MMDEGDAMIILNNIHKKFGSYQALQSISLHIKKGTIHGVIGASGAGKSTLMRIMNLLESPDSGDVIIDGQKLTTLGPRDLRHTRQSIGMIFQSYQLIENKTVYDNVSVALEIAKMPRVNRKARITECLQFVGLAHLQNQYPSQLSGGQRQRVAIARAIVNQPKVLLCDEPTSSLDPRTTNEILKVLTNINRTFGITIVIVSHEMEVIKSICEYVTIIENGEVYDDFALQPTGMLAIEKGAAGLKAALLSGGGNHHS